jgi:hypothetical protein
LNDLVFKKELFEFWVKKLIHLSILEKIITNVMGSCVKNAFWVIRESRNYKVSCSEIGKMKCP